MTWIKIEKSLHCEISTGRARAQLNGLTRGAEASDEQLVEAFNGGTHIAAALLALRYMHKLRIVSRSAHVHEWDWANHAELIDVQAQQTMAAFYAIVRKLADAEDIAKAIYWKTLKAVTRSGCKCTGVEVLVDAQGRQLLTGDFDSHIGPRPHVRTRVDELPDPNQRHQSHDDVTMADVADWARSRSAREQADLEILEAKFRSDRVHTTRELADELGLNENTVETRIRRARARLRSAIAEPRTGLFAEQPTAAA